MSGCSDKISDTCGGKKINATCVKYQGEIGENSPLIQCDCHTVEEIEEDQYQLIDLLFTAVDTSNFLGDGCITYPEKPSLLQVVTEHDSIIKELAEKAGLCDPNCPDCNPVDDCSTSSTCCPLVATVTLNLTQIRALHTTSIPLIVPPTGFGIRLSKPPVAKVYDAGTNFIFASGEYVEIKNNALVLDTLSQFSDPCIVNGIFSGSYFQTYQAVVNGALTASATAAITGGGVSAKIEITLYYELISY